MSVTMTLRLMSVHGYLWFVVWSWSWWSLCGAQNEVGSRLRVLNRVAKILVLICVVAYRPVPKSQNQATVYNNVGPQETYK
jgi:hypothetical protein